MMWRATDGVPAVFLETKIMVRRRHGNKLERWEIALVKAMLKRGDYNDQDILTYFTRPTRSINHARIADIRTGAKFGALKAATNDELDKFLLTWPEVDAETGLSIRGDELLIKAREAMIAAVHTFNGAGLKFRVELFIVTGIIAWTYLLHAWFKREGIDYLYKDDDGSVKKTKQGADRYWELRKCLNFPRCPISKGTVTNLEFLLELRNEIEHRSTNRIDDAISAKLQACCLNFNDSIKKLFGKQYALERRLPIALQFVTFSSDQRSALKKSGELPKHIETLIDAFEHGLSDDEYADPAYRYRVAFVPITANRKSAADAAIEFVKGDSIEGQDINRILLKEVNKQRYTPTQVWKLMQKEGYPKFKQQQHTVLWRTLAAKNPVHNFGCEGDYRGTWVWYDKWIDRVRAHCQENKDKYT